MNKVRNITEFRKYAYGFPNMEDDHGAPSGYDFWDYSYSTSISSYVPVGKAYYAEIESGLYAGCIAYAPHIVGSSNKGFWDRGIIYLYEKKHPEEGEQES